MTLVFLINNYDMIITTLRTAEVTESQEYESFQELQQAQIDRFVEMELGVDFGDMIDFLKHAEQQISEPTKINQELMKTVAKTFSGKWQNSIQRINADVS